MSDLASKLKVEASASAEPKPLFFNLSDSADEEQLEVLLEKEPKTKIIDTYETQLKELMTLEEPMLYQDKKLLEKFPAYRDEHYGEHEAHQAGNWVYLPWRGVLLHIVEDDLYQDLRTARNRNLITPEEQDKFYDSTIGIAGLSVGNSVALAIVQTGGGKRMRLADPDILELTNLNRIRGSIAELTEPKVYQAARQIYELDPYAELQLYTEGITEENISDFTDGLDVMIDEIDQLGMKIRIRQECKKRKIPIVMAADNGDGGVLDVERHDLDDNIEYFHGRAGDDIADKVLGQKLPPPAIGRIIGENLIGYDVTDPKMQDSLLEVGRSIPTWPQLGTAAWLNGLSVAMVARHILTGNEVVDNRALLTLNSWLVPDWNSDSSKEERSKKTSSFAEEFNARIDAVLEKIKNL